MRRLVTLIALLFAFAAVAGATTAHAHRYISTPMAVLNLVDENNQSIPVIVLVQRGEIDLGSGIMMPCGAHPGIPVTLAQMPVCATAGVVKPGLNETAAKWVGTSPLRPPKHA